MAATERLVGRLAGSEPRDKSPPWAGCDLAGRNASERWNERAFHVKIYLRSGLR
jgi:hypothetical protein